MDGTVPPRALTTGVHPQFPLDISRDGQLAFMESFGPTRSDIWVIPLDGSAPPRPLVQTPGDDLLLAFSPDDRSIAYSSDFSGHFEVYVEPFPSPGARQQASVGPRSAGGAFGPVWAHGGRTLYYVQFSKRPGTIMEVAMQTTPARPTDVPPRFFATFPYIVSSVVRSHDVTPDGRRFVVTTCDQPSAMATTELHVIVNW